MEYHTKILLLLTAICFCMLSLSNLGSAVQDNLEISTQIPFPHTEGDWKVSQSSANLEQCAAPWCNDPLGFDGIKHLHSKLDDNFDGNVDLSESDGFLREELQYTDNRGNERHKAFHRDDKHISVKDLWINWKHSHVHNWTIEETTEWLVECVELPEYSSNFKESAVDGSILPRLASNNMNYMANILGIKDPIHKRKIALKAMDAVLFGSPKPKGRFWTNVLLATSVVIAILGCWFAFVQHKHAQNHLKKMMGDMECLQKAEEALTTMQKQLDAAREEQEKAELDKKKLERRLEDELIMANKQKVDDMDHEEEVLRIRELEEENRSLREELHRTEDRLENSPWVAPVHLQSWLQLTYEVELKNFNNKKLAAEAQLQSAKEGCEKLKKKRTSLMGSLRIAHGSSIDDVDERILQAKAALTEVTQDLQERMQRWRAVEFLCGCPIMSNPGLLQLQAILSRQGGHYSPPMIAGGSVITGSQDNLDDIDSMSSYGAPTISAVHQLVRQSASLFMTSVHPSVSHSATNWSASTASMQYSGLTGGGSASHHQYFAREAHPRHTPPRRYVQQMMHGSLGCLPNHSIDLQGLISNGVSTGGHSPTINRRIQFGTSRGSSQDSGTGDSVVLPAISSMDNLVSVAEESEMDVIELVSDGAMRANSSVETLITGVNGDDSSNNNQNSLVLDNQNKINGQCKPTKFAVGDQDDCASIEENTVDSTTSRSQLELNLCNSNYVNNNQNQTTETNQKRQHFTMKKSHSHDVSTPPREIPSPSAQSSISEPDSSQPKNAKKKRLLGGLFRHGVSASTPADSSSYSSLNLDEAEENSLNGGCDNTSGSSSNCSSTGAVVVPAKEKKTSFFSGLRNRTKKKV